MRKTWKIRYHQNSLTLNILPLLCAKRGKEIVLSAPYYRQVIALSPHCLWFKAQIKAAPKIKLHDKWSHKAPYWKSNLRRAFRFWRLQRQLQGSGCDKVALGVLTPAALCTCLNMATAMQTFTAPTQLFGQDLYLFLWKDRHCAAVQSTGYLLRFSFVSLSEAA